jgi:hypothetical protein
MDCFFKHFGDCCSALLVNSQLVDLNFLDTLSLLVLNGLTNFGEMRISQTASGDGQCD